MTDVSGFFVNYLCNSLWQLPVFALAALVLERFLRRVGPLVQHRLWVSALLAAVIVPALSTSTKVINWTQTATGVSSYSIKVSSVPNSTAVHLGSVQLPYVFLDLALAVYLLIGLFAAIRFLNALRRTRALMRTGAPFSIEIHRYSFSKALRLDEVTVLSSATIATPVTIGWRRPVLFVPPDLDEWHSDDVAAALAHECAHIRRHDFLWNLLYEVLTLIVFYHPVTWFMKSRIAATRETVCDAIAAEQTAAPASYARALLRIAGAVSIRPATAPAIGMFDGNVLEKRIMELMESRQPRSKGLKALIVVTAIAVFAAVCVGANAFSTNVEEQPKTGDVLKSEAPLPEGCYKVGGEVSEPKLMNKVNPVFPPKAKEEKRTGSCTLEMIIDDKGLPQDIKVVKSLAPDFDESAMSAVKQWRFQPATLKGKAVAVRVTTQINFQLN